MADTSCNCTPNEHPFFHKVVAEVGAGSVTILPNETDGAFVIVNYRSSIDASCN